MTDKIELFPISVMGVPIGFATGWDQIELIHICLYEFQPLNGINLIAGDMNVNYETGFFQHYDRDGALISSVRIYDILKSVLDCKKHTPKSVKQIKATNTMHEMVGALIR